MSISVTEEQLSAFEHRMREKEKREAEERIAELRRTAREISLSVDVKTGPASTHDGSFVSEAKSIDFPGLIAYRALGDEAEKELRAQIEELAFERLSEDRDPYTGQKQEEENS